MARKRRTARRSSPVRRRRSSTGRKVTRRRRMGAGMATANIKGAAFNSLLGVAGGLLFGFAAKLADKDNSKPNNRIIVGLGLSILAAVIAKKPAIAAGIAGATAALIATKVPGLADYDVDFVAPDTLMSESPNLIYDENNQAYFPLSDGSFFPLNDYQASAYNQAKQANLVNANVANMGRGRNSSGNFNAIYPGYLNPGMF